MLSHVNRQIALNFRKSGFGWSLNQPVLKQVAYPIQQATSPIPDLFPWHDDSSGSSSPQAGNSQSSTQGSGLTGNAEGIDGMVHLPFAPFPLTWPSCPFLLKSCQYSRE